ncbi:DUF368 domain-containing protein [Salisediminibacterium halotolerans]|uniref:Membrane protein n=1 Tax=Salisediminibacterium halotolerans TaxID=517425 RepID=A0A1H9VC07_9BACI|nr:MULTISPECIES: DUF368 domain-containing protein [Salisediminibacterium]GEL06828.1 DUF368 domain-containing protein [Salisediminibacterium halotolerans]SES19081.1 putative membrane protein [Salisediminibacterium haloalkalitolerans]
MNWQNIYRGALMGVSNIIPGVSAGTIALVLGIYDRLISSISDFFSKRYKEALPFLLPLGIGVVGGILIFGRLIGWLLAEHAVPTQFFFLGLIIGVIPLIFKEGEMRTAFRPAHFLLTVTVAVMLALLAVFLPEEGARSTFILTAASGVWLFVAGAAASVSLLLPGISGAIVLILFGVYEPAIHALNTLNLPVIFILVFGIALGFILSSKLIRYVLHTYPYATYAVILGLLAGSLFHVYPGIDAERSTLILSAFTLAGGFFLAFKTGGGSADKKERVS